MNKLELKKVYKKYNDQDKYVLEDISLIINNGEFVSIMGRSGSGKTTLLNLISTIDKIDKGVILFEDKDISKLNDKQSSEFRKNDIGFVFQDYMLLDSLTIRENIAVALSLKNVNKQEIDVLIDKYAEMLGIYNQLEKYPYQLSGGQKQRVAIARAIIKKPLILFADEPTGALDLKSSKDIMEIFENINKELNITIVMVTHDAISSSYSDRVIFLKDGKIEKEIYRKNSKMFYEDILGG
ncbi:ABC transporter ATP-binding protein [Streptobacillus moniliformis]|uniref:ABC transporter related protein n=1 Tax=Streptobacillus moniliformis (strain ATCC 14647 / DSM 12112 / NCTC 10651 / 9901) TaxID=519441 RepID=D1AVR9_STRM9|nr:ABC transporter ATP-binding protein [Streptobacillus moniliformis]ACZ01829.1 ABC transporter related protein [Streptobacillus moniliformis DSM 12112]AVL43177.1 ABC transporter ATP-binding protein [Streptobacillus moniliformis]SQA12973.1 Lipoprotein-releasing system ATP-binding protein LolD [Streptobacillus moniliformis]